MIVSGQQSQEAMWGKNRLTPNFIRSVKLEKRPVGRVYEDKSTTPSEHKAEVEEVYVVQLFDPETNKEHGVVIDPRHAQARDHLKLVQDVMEGRTGGLTPVRMQFEDASALDPNGTPIYGTEITRVAEMESPTPTRAEAKVVVGEKEIGDWTAELDAEVDRAVSFEVAERFAGHMKGLEIDPAETEWKALDALARKKLRDEWSKTIADPDRLDQEIERFAPTREEFLAGRHTSKLGGAADQSVWDPTRSPLPATHPEQATYLYQQALVERFQESMQSLQLVDTEGKQSVRDVLTHVEGELIKDKHLPAGRPKRNPAITEMIVDEKSRQTATHMLAGYLRTQGARVRDADLEGELKDEWRMHADVMDTMTKAGINPKDQPQQYFNVAKVRAGCYRKDASLKVEKEARKCLDFPVRQIEEDTLSKTLNSAANIAKKVETEVLQAGETVESISFGL